VPYGFTAKHRATVTRARVPAAGCALLRAPDPLQQRLDRHALAGLVRRLPRGQPVRAGGCKPRGGGGGGARPPCPGDPLGLRPASNSRDV
jgi:hypothetical protein